MSHYKPYPAYKDSGVEWLGQVPEHWGGLSLKYLVSSIESGTSVNATDVPAGEGELGVLKTSCVYSGNFDPSENKAIVPDEYARASCPLVIGSLIVSRMNTPDLVGATGLVNNAPDGIFLPDRLWQVSFSGVVSPFVYYWSQSALYRAQVKVACSGTSASMQNLSQDQFKDFVLGVPPEAEQQIIAAHLDRETARIDALIAKKTRFIELLREKRQALITHAVTKGLNPNVKMKDSGVEWLGEVPEHWEIKRLQFLCSSIKAGPFGSALTKDMYVSDGYRVYGQEQVIPGDFSIGDYYITPEYFSELAQYAVQPGDVLVSCVGTFGKIAVVPEGVEPGIINPRLIRIRVNQLVSPLYLTMLMRSGVVFEQFSLWSRGGTMDVINIGTLSGIVLSVPPASEQQAILAYVEYEAGRIDALTNKTKRSIALLKERRSALITAAVTGQIDLRGAV